MIELNLDLSIAANNALVEKGLRKNYLITDDRYRQFTEHELEYIEEIKLENAYDITDLYKLKNLKRLNIKSIDYNKLSQSIDYNDSFYINHITDFSVLSNLSNLEELIIANDLFINELDLSSMNNLHKLILINNPNLTKIVGLDSLKNLNEVTMYGNNISGDNFNFEQYARNTILCVENSLDISMYLGIIKNSRKGAKELQDSEIKGTAFVRFAEKSGFLNYVCLSLRDVGEMYLKLDTYFNTTHAYDLSENDKLEFVYRYIVNNIKFDKKLIIDRNIAYETDMTQYNEIPTKIRKMFNNFHSSYFASHFKRANCEGRANLMVFMLKMLGVEATNIHCHDNRSDINGSNHSMVRVSCSDGYVYSDPSIWVSMPNASELSKKFICTDYDFISNYVTLDSYEYSLSQNNIRYSYYK